MKGPELPLVIHEAVLFCLFLGQLVPHSDATFHGRVDIRGNINLQKTREFAHELHLLCAQDL